LSYQAHLEGLKKDLTVEENITFYRRLRNIAEVNSEYMTELGLDAVRQRPVRQLSAGQKRRVTLAILAALRARVWLLDEPLTNLDTAGRALVARWLHRHLAQGGLAVIATHQAKELERQGSLLVEL
jgi:heme exporter protein A